MSIHFFHTDGSGVATKINLAPSLPKPTAGRAHVYECAMFSPPGKAQSAACEITDLVTGALATGTVTADLPATATALTARVIHSVGGTSSVIGLCLFSLYVETDD